MKDCLFCKIAAGEIPSKEIYSDPVCYAFADISPQAGVHVLVIPREHIPSAAHITPENSGVVAHIFEAIPKIAESLGLEKGFRIISNAGEHGCQSVFHLHFHILGGQKLPENMV